MESHDNSSCPLINSLLITSILHANGCPVSTRRCKQSQANNQKPICSKKLQINSTVSHHAQDGEYNTSDNRCPQEVLLWNKLDIGSKYTSNCIKETCQSDTSNCKPAITLDETPLEKQKHSWEEGHLYSISNCNPQSILPIDLVHIFYFLK